MKIVRKNKPWSIELECTGKGNDYENGNRGRVPCNTTLEINGKDVFQTKSYDMEGSNTCYTFKCPCCGCLTDIDKNLLPNSVKYYAEGRTEIDVIKEYNKAEDNTLNQ